MMGMEKVFKDSRVIARLRGGACLGKSLDAFALDLIGAGYVDTTIQSYLRAAGHFDYWLCQERIALSQMDETVIHRFMNHLLECQCSVPIGKPLSHVRSACLHILRALRKTGQISGPVVPKQTSRDLILFEFEGYLARVRGVVPLTCTQYSSRVREFLVSQFGESALCFERLEIRDLHRFIERQAPRSKTGKPKAMITALRSFLRFLQVHGRCNQALVAAVPTIPTWKLSRIPKTLTPLELKSFLGAFDRESATGRRDYAIALCMAELGLRAQEVAFLSLEDFDWRTGVIRIAVGKSRRATPMPLPAKVGRAIVAYLRRGRPKIVKTRRLFVRHCVPHGTPIGSDSIRAITRRAFERTGLQVASKGTHILRHTAASRMLQGGASLKEIADVLRHRSIDTTVMYTKVDIPSLAQVALPWPGVQQ